MNQTELNSNSLGKVAVLMGGASSEREISLMSGHGILEALKEAGVDAHGFDPARRSLYALKDEKFNSCFIALHGRYGEDGTIQGALELMGIPYTGSGVMASSICIDKVMTKRIWSAEGLSTPKWQDVNSVKSVEKAFMEMGSPIIIKPSRDGSTLGLSKITNLKDCSKGYEVASKLDTSILCEEFICGDEVTVPVIGSGSQAYALPLIRIEAVDGNYDYQNKYFTDTTKYWVPSGLPLDEEFEIKALVLKAYKVLGCRGWGRVDVMIDASTRAPYLLEINTSPGMTSHSLVPMSAKADGIDYNQLCLRILKEAALDYQVLNR